jgi:hypothetical protein
MATPAATATLLKYAPVVEVDLSGNKIEFADSEEAGHRVQIDIAASDLNTCFLWSRPVGSDRPVGSIVKADFTSLLNDALTTFTDLDGIASGLSFTTNTLANSANQSDNVNDLIMAYVLYKVYGATNYNTDNKVFNVGDALNMVTNEQVANAVEESLDDNNDRGGAVDQMFRDLLAANPTRFFNADGKQEAGLFETNADAAGSGNWKLIANDIIEIKLEFTFAAKVSRRVVSSQQQPTTAGNASTTPARAETVTEETVIPANSKLKVRLQIKASA